MTKALVAVNHATYGGIYYSAAYTGSGAQPTWTKLTTTGLPSLIPDIMRVDYQDPLDVQYLGFDCVNASGVGTIYMRNAGNWTKVMDTTIAQTATSEPLINLVNSLWTDPTAAAAGDVWCVATYQRDALFSTHYILHSTDYGSTWAVEGSGTYQKPPEHFQIIGTNAWASYGKNLLAYTVALGSNNLALGWGSTSLVAGLGWAAVNIDPIDPSYCYMQIVAAGVDKLTCTGVNVVTKYNTAFPGYGSQRTDQMFVDPYNLGYAVSLGDALLYWTTDRWATYNTVVLAADEGTTLATAALTNLHNEATDDLVFGSKNGGSGAGIWHLTDKTDTLAIRRSGTNYNTPPYTNAIPYVGYVPIYGIWAGEPPAPPSTPSKGIDVYSVELGDITSLPTYTGLGDPMFGDRSSWRDMPADGFDDYHAQDVEADTPQIHAPWDNASPPGAGYGIISDGTKWEVSSDVIALASDLHDAVTLDADAAAILDLQGAGGQEIGLDVQSANTVLAGPTTGAANEPTFRALVEADIDEILTFGALADVTLASEIEGDVVYYDNDTSEWLNYPLGIGENVVHDGNEVQLGNVTGGNYVGIGDASGEVRLYGDATAWDDVQITVVLRNTGATTRDPSFTQWFDNGAGSRGVYVYGFEDEAVNEKELFFTIQMTHRQDPTAAIHVHVHWIGDTTADPAVVRWGLEYNWKSPLETFGDTTIIYATALENDASTGITAYKHNITEFTALTPDGTQNGLSSIFIGRIFRSSSNAADTYTGGVAGLLAVDAHVLIDSFGSVEEYTKYADFALLLESGDRVLLESGDLLLLEEDF